MSAGFWADARSLASNIRFIVGGPRIIMDAYRDTREVLARYEQVVSPILNDYILDTGTRRWLTESLRSYSATACWVIKAYTRMADIAFIGDLAVLGASFNRLYDDLFDQFDDEALAARLSGLLRSGDCKPCSDVERVLLELYRRISGLLNRDADDPIFDAAVKVHEFQVRSRCQRDTTSPETLLGITRGKGGYAVVVMFALMRKSMSAEEINLLLPLGEAIQLLDDYQDEELDAENGINTLATEGLLGLSDVADILRNLHPEFCRFYGRKRVAGFWTFFHVIMLLSFLGHHWPRLRVSHYPSPKETGAVLRTLFASEGRLSRGARCE